MNAIVPPPPPAEYVGKARVFRSRIQQSDEQFVQMRDAVWTALVHRVRCKPTFRKPESIDLLRCWQSLRLFGQSPQTMATMDYTKKKVEFVDTRLITMTRRRGHWEDGDYERGLMLCIIRVTAEPGHVNQRIVSTATFGIHSIARFFQRSFHTDDETLVRAIWSVLGKGQPTMETVSDKFALPVPCGGHWFGEVTIHQPVDEHFEPLVGAEWLPNLAVRTYHTGVND